MRGILRKRLAMPVTLAAGVVAGTIGASAISSSAQETPGGTVPTGPITVRPNPRPPRPPVSVPTPSGEVRIVVQYHGYGEGGGQSGTGQLESHTSLRRSNGDFTQELLARGRGAKVWVWSDSRNVDGKAFTANVAVGIQASGKDRDAFASPFAACASYLTSPRHITQPYIPTTPWWEVEVRVPNSTAIQALVNQIATGAASQVVGIDLQASQLTYFRCGSETLL